MGWNRPYEENLNIRLQGHVSVCVYTSTIHTDGYCIKTHHDPIKPRLLKRFPKWAEKGGKKKCEGDNMLDFSPEFSSILQWRCGLIVLAQVIIKQPIMFWCTVYPVEHIQQK